MKPAFVKIILFISLPILILVSSCTIQSQLSKDFNKYSDSVSVLIVGSSNLQKVSLVVERLYPQFDELSADLKDTVWKHQTKFLNSVEDSAVLNIHYRFIIQQLKKTKIKIFTDDKVDEFVKQSGPKWIFRIAQIQLEEDRQKVDFSTELKGQEELYKDMEIEILSVNVWFEVFTSENDTAPKTILYLQKTISDEVKGRFFETIDGKFEFRFNRTDIMKEDILKLSELSANNNAQQITNYIFTKYIRTYYPESEEVYGYSIDRKKFYIPTENEVYKELK